MSKRLLLVVTLMFERHKEEYTGKFYENEIEQKEIYIRDAVQRAIQGKSVVEIHLPDDLFETNVVVEGSKLLGFVTKRYVK